MIIVWLGIVQLRPNEHPLYELMWTFAVHKSHLKFTSYVASTVFVGISLSNKILYSSMFRVSEHLWFYLRLITYLTSWQTAGFRHEGMAWNRLRLFPREVGTLFPVDRPMSGSGSPRGRARCLNVTHYELISKNLPC